MRYLLTFIALLFAAPAAAETLPASCETLPALLASAQGGETFVLTGECGTVEIARSFPRRVTIDARRALVANRRDLGSQVLRPTLGGSAARITGSPKYFYDVAHPTGGCTRYSMDAIVTRMLGAAPYL